MRVLPVLFFLCLSVVSLSARDLAVGKVGPNDVILYHETVVPKQVIPTKSSKYIIYPKHKSDENATITAIFVKDNRKDGTGGNPYIVEGGVGQKFVKIEMRTRGLLRIAYNSTVTIYGRY